MWIYESINIIIFIITQHDKMLIIFTIMFNYLIEYSIINLNFEGYILLKDISYWIIDSRPMRSIYQ